MSAVDLKLDAENVWWEQSKYENAFEQWVSNSTSSGADAGDAKVLARVDSLEKKNAELEKTVSTLKAAIDALQKQVASLTTGASPAAAPAAAVAAPAAEAEEDDDIDLFGDDEVDEEAEKIKAQRVADYEAKKAKKVAAGNVVIPKSNIILDVKPWDDETDLKEMERLVRSIEADGLIWGASKLMPVGYGIKKLQICCVVEDDKVGTDFLEEQITSFEDLVQSMDIVSFNKI